MSRAKFEEWWRREGREKARQELRLWGEEDGSLGNLAAGAERFKDVCEDAYERGQDDAEQISYEELLGRLETQTP